MKLSSWVFTCPKLAVLTMRLLIQLFSSLVLLWYLPFASCAPSSRALQCCASIASSTRVATLSWQTSLYTSSYTYARSHYWSSANGNATPACVVLLTSAQEAASVVLVLLQYPDVGFATKSGGHSANVGFGSTDGGMLFAMSALNATTLSVNRKTAYLSPGARWMDAVGALELHGATVVGRRVGTFVPLFKSAGWVGDVGVGGRLIGCGLSFLSAQYGLPCDNSQAPSSCQV